MFVVHNRQQIIHISAKRTHCQQGVRDDFPDAQLFQVEVLNSTEINEELAYLWITKMVAFLNTKLPPEGMSLDE